MKALREKRKYWLGVLKVNVFAFCKHPIQFTKNYIRDFKAASTEEKVKKVLKLIGAGIGLYYAAVVVLSIFMLLIVLAVVFGQVPTVSDDTIDMLQGAYRSRHGGRNAQSLSDLYRG